MRPDLPFTISRHAAIRIQEMAIPPLEILRAYERPDSTQTTRHANRRHYVRGPIALVMDVQRKEIITVLWQNRDVQYNRHDPSLVWEGGGWIDY